MGVMDFFGINNSLQIVFFAAISFQSGDQENFLVTRPEPEYL